jgi:hypothetical protein
MSSIVETIAAIIILTLAVIFLLHLINGDATTWLKSKFIAADPSATKGSS